MTGKFQLNSCLLLFLIFAFYGCFKEDTPIEPVAGRGIKISNNIYHYQSFYDLSSDSISTNANDAWDLAFESAPDGWHIRINYSNFLGIYRTRSIDFSSTNYSVSDKGWLYDASSGNPDSTAIGNWQEPINEGMQVYLLGTYDGVRYKPTKKLRFNSVTDTSFSFSFANPDNSGAKEVVLKKNPDYNYTYYSFAKQESVQIEPPKNNWDILFTQYTTTLFTNEGLPTPYIVRGVYLNPYNVKAMVDSLIPYANITSLVIDQSKFSSIQDAIGYNWKAVEINQSSNTARYAVRKNYTYILQDTQGDFYKLHFLSYVNDSLIVGFPVFEKDKLE